VKFEGVGAISMEMVRVGASTVPGNQPGSAVYAERRRLVRLCWRLTGDVLAAEDLAQETLLEALRHAHKFRGGDRSAWLGAIARHVCRRWARRRGQELARRVLAPTGPESGAPPSDEPQLADAAEIGVELERAELAELLDRALALLPPTTRQVVLMRYVGESSLAETAARLGISTGAVAMRLHRGKLALRRVLRGELGQDAAAAGIASFDQGGWQPTPLWCLACGRNRLLGKLDEGGTWFRMRCGWDGCPAGETAASRAFPEPLGGADVYRRGFHRLIAEATAYYRAALATGVARCTACGRPTRLRRGEPPWGDRVRLDTLFFALCGACGGTTDFRSSGFVLATAEAQRFWRAHPRMRLLPEREVEAGGRPALVTTFASTTGAARLEAVSDRATLRLLAVHGAPT
jgi:RNA polymerase sigma factor (sigma-70 family)